MASDRGASAPRRFDSLRIRLIAVSAVVMVAFTALAVGVIDNAFERTARGAVNDQLNAQLYALLTAAEINESGRMFFPERLAEPRFSVAGSGLYAFAYDDDGIQAWSSSSAVSPSVEPAVRLMGLGDSTFALETTPRGVEMFVMRFGVAWESQDGAQRDFTMVVAEDLARFRAQVGEFRRNLFFWSAVGIGVLIALQLAILNWALRPLSAVAREIRRVERGTQQYIEGSYPEEISGLTRNINRLIESSHRSLQRYRNSLGDLAHSLKTPLAVLRGLSEESGGDRSTRDTLAEQTRRMADIVDYQLKRAASSGGDAAVRVLGVRTVAGKLVRTMEKVYADRGIAFEIDVDERLQVMMDEGDLMEVLGNLLENACKWCRSRVAVRAVSETAGVRIRVEDDGPGVDPELARDLLRRGVRADQKTPGQGIGLSVVRSIVESYGGSVAIDNAAGGGASVRVTIPRR